MTAESQKNIEALRAAMDAEKLEIETLQYALVRAEDGQEQKGRGDAAAAVTAFFCFTSYHTTHTTKVYTGLTSRRCSTRWSEPRTEG